MKLDGRQLAEGIRDRLKLQVEDLKKRGVAPHLAVVLIGNNPNSLIYVRQKRIQAEKVGVIFSLHKYSPETPYAKVVAKIKRLGNDSTIHGLIVQRPIPPPFSNDLTNLVPSEKDVDGFLSNSPFDPPVALAVLKCLESIFAQVTPFKVSTYRKFLQWLRSKKIIILGRGETAGKPIAQLFTKHEVPFEVIHSKTKNRQSLLKSADIMITAVGKPRVVMPTDLKRGVILIGIGLDSENEKLIGDYDESQIESIASFYTPTPGGTGPVNVASLVENVVRAAGES